MTEPLPADVAQALHAAGDRIGACAGRVAYLSEVSSTNDVALRLAAAGAGDGTTVLAGAQTAGRGRHGRRWFSAAGAGLYFSVVVRGGGRGPAPLTLMAGVAVAEGVRAATGLPAEIEWPNDVVAPARGAYDGGARPAKLAGILTEAARPGGAVVVGIGINVAPTPYPPDVAARAGSLAAETDGPIERAAVLVETLAALARWRRALAAGDTARMLARWRELAPGSRDTVVEWSVQGRRRRGVTTGIDQDGALLVRRRQRIERLVAGEVTRVVPALRATSGEDD